MTNKNKCMTWVMVAAIAGLSACGWHGYEVVEEEVVFTETWVEEDVYPRYPTYGDGRWSFDVEIEWKPTSRYAESATEEDFVSYLVTPYGQWLEAGEYGEKCEHFGPWSYSDGTRYDDISCWDAPSGDYEVRLRNDSDIERVAIVRIRFPDAAMPDEVREIILQPGCVHILPLRLRF